MPLGEQVPLSGIRPHAPPRGGGYAGAIVLVGSDDDVKKIRSDRFKVNYYKDGARIDKVLGSGTLFEGFLKDSR
ncbi:MAG: hypothetical protein DMG79_21595, partial [Acidobacteria bacterium]